MVLFKTAAISWGCQHEKDALEMYEKTSVHSQLRISPSGFFISGEHPYFGASPDGIVCCSYCQCMYDMHMHTTTLDWAVTNVKLGKYHNLGIK